MNFLKDIVLAVYVHYRKKNDSSSAALHSRVVVSFAFLIFFTVAYLFLIEIIRWQFLSNLGLLTNKLTYMVVLVIFYLLVHFLGGTNRDLEKNREQGNKRIKTVFFICSVLGLILLFIMVPMLT
jgi:magnesium-transporting ATPase (P-type)